MRNILSGARGMAGLVLVILIAWALLSVIFLTGTLLAARSIDRSVNTAKTGINPLVENIGTDARYIDEARKIAGVSGQILTAAKPLSGQLSVIESTARTGIDPKLKSVLTKVGDINEVAGSINSNVLQIGSTVDAILGNATSINGSVQSINARGGSILRSARHINSSARSILSNAGGILSRVQSIDKRVATINSEAGTIDTTAAPIASDLNNVLKGVGAAGTDKVPGTVLFHANNIDCAAVINGDLSPVLALLPQITTVLTQLLGGPPPAIVPGSSKKCVP